MNDAGITKKSLVFWTTLSLVVFYLLWAPFNRALFNGKSYIFEGPIYTAVLIASSILFIIAIRLLLSKSIRLSYKSLLILLLPLGYLISTINSATSHGSWLLLYISFVWAIFFLIGIVLASDKSNLSLLVHTIILTGNVIVLYGFMVWFGNESYKDAILNGRMSNVFQYPNTYAAFLSALFLMSLLKTLHSTKKSSIALNSAFLFPNFLSLVLTSSRGGILVFIFSFIVFMFFLDERKKKQAFLIVGIVAVVSLLFEGFFSSIQESVSNSFSAIISIKGWIALLILSVLITCFCILLNSDKLINILGRIKLKSKYASLLIGIGIVIICSIILMAFSNGGLNERIINGQSIERSVLQRITYYKDSLALILDHPLIGVGGDGWSVLYAGYQSYPYIGNQAHNFFLQYLVEVGVLGALFLAIILFFVLRTFFSTFKTVPTQENYLLFLVFPVTVFLHSLVDFDLSYLYISSLTFFCFGVIASPKLIKVEKLSREQKQNVVLGARWVLPTIFGLLAVFVFYGALLNVFSNQFYSQAIVQLKENKPFYDNLNKSLEYAPYHPEYAGLKINVLSSLYNQTKEEKYYEEAVTLLGGLENKEPNNRQLINLKLALLQAKGEYEKASEILSKSIKKYPWDVSLHEIYFDLNFRLGYVALQEGRIAESNTYWDVAILDYASMKDKLNNASQKFQFKRGAFAVTPMMVSSIGKIHFYRGDYGKAFAELKRSLRPDSLDDSINREIARYYYVSLINMGRNDEQLYMKLQSVDPSEVDQIDALIKQSKEK